MRTHLERPARVPMWIAGITICLLTPLGMIAIGRSIPASYANIPDRATVSRQAAVLSESEDAYAKGTQATDRAVARGTIAPPNKARCPGCGVIQSMRQIDRSRDVGRKDTVGARAAGRVSSDASAADAVIGTGYEITVRFRDGGTTVFNEETPRNWRAGSRVIVIGRSTTSYN